MTNNVLEIEEMFDSIIGQKVHLFGKTFILKMVEVEEREDGKFGIEFNGKYKVVTDNIESLMKKLTR